MVVKLEHAGSSLMLRSVLVLVSTVASLPSSDLLLVGV